MSPKNSWARSFIMINLSEQPINVFLNTYSFMNGVIIYDLVYFQLLMVFHILTLPTFDTIKPDD